MSRARRTLAAALLAWLAPSGAAANEMYFTQAKIPARITEQGLKAFMRGHHQKGLREEPDHKRWKFNIGVFLRQAAGDLEAHLLFYDVERGREEFVSEMTVFLSDRDENTFLQPATLERPMFKPVNRYMAALQIRRRRLVRKDFELIGQRDERSGQVSFSDAEAEDPEEAAARRAAQEAAARRQAEETGGETEQQARERVQAEADALAAQEGADDEAAGGGELGAFDEFGEIPTTAGPGTEEGGCASCVVASGASRAAGRAGPIAAMLALAGALARRRRR